ncbi:hypothetical protein [Nocardia sp. NBC_01327]|uniref:hypothetical protein n=1 Tax=Nocardia sp. NBC_01327 TaxID=2903593 RepID=UPI002E12C1FA|nr:hypothetical protein OG326_01095 [Nocardia sp. NBC_01327]
MSGVWSALAEGGSWLVFWLQLPLLVLAIAVLVAFALALFRARPEDVPQVFCTATTLFDRWPHWLPHRRAILPQGESEHDESETTPVDSETSPDLNESDSEQEEQ